MRIESFWAKGFRSLRDVRLENLGAFNVLYGPNGSGKSNILAAMDAWLRLVPFALENGRVPGFSSSHKAGATTVWTHDFALHSSQRHMVLGGVLTELTPDVERIQIELAIDGTASQGRLAVQGLVDTTFEEFVSTPVFVAVPAPGHERDVARSASLRTVEWGRQLSLISADRIPRTEAAGERPPDGVEPLSWYFHRGHLKDALFAAQNTTSPATLRALERFRQFMAGPPLHRPAFRAVEDPHTGVHDLREWLPPPLDAHDVSLDLAGLGIAQIYWILGQAMLSGARLVGIEEPEAHLHAPTTGRHLRELLKRLVAEEHIDQLFIATHSNLFDLDPAGYWDVSLKNGETVVERADLTRIDRDHLYEPGPAKHALQRMLEYMPKEEVVFRRADGSGIAADEMLRLLQEGDDLAVRFLEDLHGAAVRMVKVGAKKKAG